MNPSSNGGKVVRHSTVQFRCTVDKNILVHDAVEWYRRQGVNRYHLGTGSISSFMTTAPRYHLAMELQTSSTAVYRLTITGDCPVNIFTLVLGIISWQKIHIDYSSSLYRDIVDRAGRQVGARREVGGVGENKLSDF